MRNSAIRKWYRPSAAVPNSGANFFFPFALPSSDCPLEGYHAALQARGIGIDPVGPHNADVVAGHGGQIIATEAFL
jgi:hypothetical protein